MKVLGKFAALALAVASAVLVVAGVLSAPAHSKVVLNAPAHSKVKASAGFTVINGSSFWIRLESVDGDGNFEGRTDDGSYLGPHQCCHRFEVQIRPFSTQRNTAHYAILGWNDRRIGTFEVHMQVYGALRTETKAQCETSYGTCSVFDDETTIVLEDDYNLARFFIDNGSSHPILLESVTGDTGGYGHTGDSPLLQAHKCCHGFDVPPDKNGSTQRVTARYAILSDDFQQIGTFEAYMDVQVGGQRATCRTSYGTCSVHGSRDIHLDDPAR